MNTNLKILYNYAKHTNPAIGKHIWTTCNKNSEEDVYEDWLETINCSTKWGGVGDMALFAAFFNVHVISCGTAQKRCQFAFKSFNIPQLPSETELQESSTIWSETTRVIGGCHIPMASLVGPTNQTIIKCKRQSLHFTALSLPNNHEHSQRYICVLSFVARIRQNPK
jgi:hypothetical protein